MKDYRIIERKAMELGIIQPDNDFKEESELLFNKYKKTKDSLSEVKIRTYLSDMFVESLIILGQKLNSYKDALLYFQKYGYLDIDEAHLLKDTLFAQYLREELENKNILKKSKKLTY